MKKWWLYILLGVGWWLWLPASVGAASSDAGWQIASFASQITVQTDGKVMVEETIQADFGSQLKHGIYRDIPYQYDDQGQASYTEISPQSVSLDGQTIPYEVSYPKGYVELKIGDPGRTISGAHTFTIRYLATGILRGFSGYDELYWNVTGDKWPVPIERATATVTLPKASIVQAACYQGAEGSGVLCQSQTGTTIAQFTASRSLAAGEGLTVAVGYTKGMVPLLKVTAPPSPWQDWSRPGTVLTILIAFLITCIVGGISLLRLRNRHKAGKSTHVVVPEYEAPLGLKPAELGALLSVGVETVYISATIVDLAVRGYLTITEIPKKGWLGKVDYQLGRTEKEAGNELLPYEHTLLNGLFEQGKERLSSSLKESFYKKLGEVKKQVMAQLVMKQLFRADPIRIRRGYYVGGMVLLVVGSGLGFGAFNSNIPWLLGLALGLGAIGILTLIIGWSAPCWTLKGQEVYNKGQGYKLFLSATERYRQPFFEQEHIFMQILPYAIVFGLAEKLAKAFAVMGIEVTEPAWYRGSQPFTALTLANSIETFSSETTKSMASMPGSSGSSGSGFSGGGFGGGGGGSW